jgi:hypothetical protein
VNGSGLCRRASLLLGDALCPQYANSQTWVRHEYCSILGEKKERSPTRLLENYSPEWICTCSKPFPARVAAHRPEATLVHSRILSQIDQQKIKRIRECMCNHRDRKVSSARQIPPTQYEAVQNILHHASVALVEVGATKRNAGHDQAYSPSDSRTTKQASHTIHEVAAINQLLSKAPSTHTSAR